MSKFCENCPMQGSAQGELQGVAHATVNYKMFLGGGYEGEMGALIDENGNVSEGMLMPSREMARDGLIASVDACSGPLMKERGIFKKHEVPVACPALGRLAIENHEVRQAVQARMAVEAVGLTARRR